MVDTISYLKIGVENCTMERWLVGGKRKADESNSTSESSDNESLKSKKRRIDDMAEDVLKQLVSRIRASRFYALQIDESTDISSLANLLAFVRYEHDGKIHEDVLFCKHLPSHTTAETIFF